MRWIEGISPITFPGLGISIDPAVGFAIGPLKVNLYGILIAVGLMLAVFYAWKRAKEFGIKEDALTDGVLWVVPFAILCARLYYCAFKWNEEGYAQDPLSILYIWKGGLAIYGGVIGAAAGTVIVIVPIAAGGAAAPGGILRLAAAEDRAAIIGVHPVKPVGETDGNAALFRDDNKFKVVNTIDVGGF